MSTKQQRATHLMKQLSDEGKRFFFVIMTTKEQVQNEQLSQCDKGKACEGYHLDDALNNLGLILATAMTLFFSPTEDNVIKLQELSEFCESISHEILDAESTTK